MEQSKPKLEVVKKVSKLKAKAPELTGPKKSKILIYGKPKVKKTWEALTFPNVYYMDSEGGAVRDHYRKRLQEAGGHYMGPEEGCSNPAEILEQFQALATEDHPYKTVVLDSYSKPYLKLIGDAVEKFAEKHGDKSDYGATKKPAKVWSKRLLNWIDRMDLNVILIAHEKDKWESGENTGVTFDGDDKYEYDLDLVLNIQERGGNSFAQIKASRLENFRKGDSFPWNYEEFAKRYGRETIESEVKPIALATPEQVTEVKKLLELIKIPEKELEKMLDAAKAESWEEMNTEIIEKAINYFKSKITTLGETK